MCVFTCLMIHNFKIRLPKGSEDGSNLTATEARTVECFSSRRIATRHDDRLRQLSPLAEQISQGQTDASCRTREAPSSQRSQGESGSCSKQRAGQNSQHPLPGKHIFNKTLLRFPITNAMYWSTIRHEAYWNKPINRARKRISLEINNWTIKRERKKPWLWMRNTNVPITFVPCDSLMFCYSKIEIP